MTCGRNRQPRPQRVMWRAVETAEIDADVREGVDDAGAGDEVTGDPAARDPRPATE